MLPFLSYLRRFDTTTVFSCFAATAASPPSPFSHALLFNKQGACLTYSRFSAFAFACRDEQLYGVTVNRGGSAALL